MPIGSSPARRAHVTVRPAIAADTRAVAALLLPFEPHVPPPSPTSRPSRPGRTESSMTVDVAAEHLRVRFADPDYHVFVAVDGEVDSAASASDPAGHGLDLTTAGSGSRAEPGTAASSARPGLSTTPASTDRAIRGQIVGVVVARFDDAGLLAPTRALAVSRLAVLPGLRRRGIGRALLTTCIELAEGAGAQYLQSSSNPGARDANRYLARVGFAAIATRRMAPVSSVRRALGLPALGLIVSQDPSFARRRARAATRASRVRDIAHPGA